MKGGTDPSLHSKLMKKLKKKYYCRHCKKPIYNQSITRHAKYHSPLTLKFKKSPNGEWYVAKSGAKHVSKKASRKRVSKKASRKRVSKRASRKRVSKKASRKRVSKKASRKRVSKRASRKRVSKKASRKRVSKKQKLCERKKIGTVMKEFKVGKLRSGSGQKVQNPKQAIAIALSVARKYCSKKK